MIAVFDFDGTLCYGISMMLLAPRPSFPARLNLLFSFFLTRVTGRDYYGESMEGLMRGLKLEEVLEKALSLPPVEGAVRFARELQQRGYRLIVISYTAKELIEAYLKKVGIKAEVYARQLIVKNGRIEGYRRDWVYEALLDAKHGKRKIVERLGIQPELCVGDHRERDRLCDNYIDVRELEEDYMPKWKQFILTRKLLA